MYTQASSTNINDTVDRSTLTNKVNMHITKNKVTGYLVVHVLDQYHVFCSTMIQLLYSNEITVLSLFVSDGDIFAYTRKEPIGVCGQIIPVSYTWSLSVYVVKSSL